MAATNKNNEIKKSNSVKQVAIKKYSNTLLAWICVAAIAIITYFVYSPSLDDGFTNRDDEFFVTENPLVVNNSVPVIKIFETKVLSSYVPLTVLSLSLNYQAGKLDPYGYHLENVILHLLNTILVFFFIFLLTRSNLMMSSIVSLFFGIHPMHLESVAWISERKDLLYVFFFLAALITYFRYSETKKTGWYIFTLVLFILSCLSKEMAIVFPVIILLVDYLRGVKWQKRLLIEKIPFFLVSLIFSLIIVKTHHYALTLIAINKLTIFHRILFASYGAILYVIKLFVPYKLSAFYPTPDSPDYTGIPLIFYFSPFILIGILSALIYFFLKKEKEIVFGLLFYFVSIALVDRFVPINPDFTPDRYSYLSYIGLLFVVAYIVNKIWLRLNRGGTLAFLRYSLVIILITGAVAFSFQTYSRAQVWKNSETLWTDVINNYPNAMAYYGLGDYYDEDMKEPEKALTFYNKAIETDSTFAKAYLNRGGLFMTYGKNDLALADFNKAIELDSTPAAYINRGLLYMNHGKNDLALVDFNKAIEFDSTLAIAYSNRGLLYMNCDKNNLALADYNKAIALNPYAAFFYYNRGLCYKALYQFDKSIDDFIKGIQSNPQNIDAYYNMIGICNISIQKYNEAIDNFSKAIDINPSVADYWFNRSLAESKIGQSENAKADEIKGKQLQAR